MYDLSKVYSPGFLFLVCIGALSLLIAGLHLMPDIKRMRRELQEGITFVWYQRPAIVSGLKALAVTFLAILLAYVMILTAVYPLAIFTCVLAGLTCGFILNKLITEMRKGRRERQENHHSPWYRCSEPLRWIVLGCFIIASLIVLVVTLFLLMQGTPPPSFLTPADLVIYIVLFVITIILSTVFIALYALRNR